MKIHGSRQSILALLAVVFLGFILRAVGIGWDNGYYLHPDERAIFLFSLPLALPGSISSFFSPESPLNPEFFAYGSFPLYLLRFALFLSSFLSPQLGGYDEGYIIGRIITVVIDTGTIFLVYLLGKRVFSATVGLIGAFFYAVAVFPIQNSHFYISDVFLTFFLLLSFVFFLYFHSNKRTIFLLLSSAAFGMALASKVSATPFFLVIVVGLLFASLVSFSFFRKKGDRHTFKILLSFIWLMFLYGSVAIFIFLLFMPYAVIDFSNFWRQVGEQQQMTKSAFTFPYTLQYVGKIPYLYETRQIILWGLGLPLSLLSFAGFGYFFFTTVRSFSLKHIDKLLPSVLMLFFFVLFFGIVGSFAVGWMRYMLPLYPYLVLFAAFFSVFLFRKLTSFHTFKKLPYLRYGVIVLLLFACSLWTLSFLHIYFAPHSRVAASAWIHGHIPPGSSLGVEHWDDRLPLRGGERYIYVELPLYEPDTPEKWQMMHEKIQQSDYIILASNRLYTPLQKMTNCGELPPGKCYRQTASYYRRLFSGQLGFEKVAEFSSYPTIPLLNIPIHDQGGDESFTVYDHPKVMIFKKK